jgi:hypothetical protein
MSPVAREIELDFSHLVCPNCRECLEKVFSPDHNPDLDGRVAWMPEPGDYTICLSCSAILKFGSAPAFGLLLVSLDELGTLVEDNPSYFTALGIAWYRVKQIVEASSSTVH